jgi:hypothetical protein
MGLPLGRQPAHTGHARRKSLKRFADSWVCLRPATGIHSHAKQKSSKRFSDSWLCLWLETTGLHGHSKRKSSCKGSTLTNLLALVLVGPVQGCSSPQFSGTGLIGPVQGRSSHKFSGIGVGRPNARTQLSPIFWQWFW